MVVKATEMSSYVEIKGHKGRLDTKYYIFFFVVFYSWIAFCSVLRFG